MQVLKRGLFFLLISLLGTNFSAGAQAQMGNISGVVRDASTGYRVSGATVAIEGSQSATTSNEEGAFVFVGVPIGQHSLRITYVGYQQMLVEGVIVMNESETSLEIDITQVGEAIAEVVVTTARSRGSEITLLAEQQRSTMIVQRIGTQELSRRGLGDAAVAVTKMSGISKAEGSNQVYVRGLGDRYNATSLNGLPLPSNDPERKNILLDIFNTEIIEYIAVDKTYNSQMAGDFAGGNIDIYSKDFNAGSLFEVSVSSTVNSQAVGQSGSFRLHEGPGRWGYSTYSIPDNPLGGFNFQHSMNPQTRNPFPGSVRVLGGKSFHLGSESRLNLFASASYGNNFEYRNGFNRAVNAQGANLLSLDQERYTYNTNTTGLFNASYILNNKHKLSYNFMMVNSSQQSNDVFTGFIRDLAEDNNGLMQRGTYAQTRLFVNQLLGRHQLNDRLDLDWGLSANTVAGIMPDRIQNSLRYQPARDGYVLIQNTTTDNHRYNQRLDEYEYALNLNATYKLGDDYDPNGLIRAGYSGRMKKRNFEAIQFNFRVNGDFLNTLVDPNNLDAFFNADNYNNSNFRIESFAGETPQTYSGAQDVHAGYLSWEQNLSDRLTSVIGIRYEYLRQGVDWRTQLDPEARSNTFTKHAVLPNLNLRYTLSEQQNLRLAASKTYTLPQFKERALFVYEDIPDKKRGNPDMYPSDNYNLDLKWEYFPASGELISVTAFGKYIQNPINETTIASSSNDISFINIGDVGTVIGVEVELRKDIFSLRNGADVLSLGFNAAYMNTNQDLNSGKVARETTLKINLTDSRSSFTGASDLLLNTDLTYTKRWSNTRHIMATVAYSYASDKVYSLGVEQRGNLVDKGLGMLDFVLKSRINQRVGLDLMVRNLLDPAYERVQENASGPIPVMSYKKGRFFSLGVNYRF